MPHPVDRDQAVTAVIQASPEAVFRALTDPAALEVWQAPGDMTGMVHAFDLRVGGGYEMSLYYPEGGEGHGKSSDREDRFSARFLEIEPPVRLVEAIVFATDIPEFSGEMLMTITCTPRGETTEVAFAYANVPPGIAPEDNREGTRQSLANLAAYVETH